MKAKHKLARHDSETSDRNKLSKEEKYSNASKVLNPVNRAALNLRSYNTTFGELDLSGLATALTGQTKKIANGNTEPGETMLAAQAYTLDTIFNTLVGRAVNNIGPFPENTERYLKLAFKAQAQCRATWEAVSTIQNPPLASYVNQANVAHGPQQVNNASAATKESTRARARRNKKLQNKLLEEQDGKRLDTGTTVTAGEIDQEMETVAEVHRTQVCSRKKSSRQ